MAYAVMRFEKIKANKPAEIGGSLSHTFRSRYTANADPIRRKDNQVLLGPETPDEVKEAVRARWPTKYRRDAVGCIEFMITASPEWFREHGGHGDAERYFDRSIRWLQQHFGADNVVSVVRHNDETTPHIAAYVVPIDPITGGLNAKHFTNGKVGCSELQTSFHRHAGGPVGLDRGKRGSTAKHMSISRWYAGQSDLDERKSELDDYKLYLEDLEEQQALALAMRETEVESRELGVQQQAQGLAGRARRLDTRETDIAQAESEVVAQRAALERQAADLRSWEARRDAWLAEHRPVSLGAVEELSLDLAALPEAQRIQRMRQLHLDDQPMAKAVRQLGWVSYDTGGVTDAGQRALVEHGSLETAERRLTEWEASGLEPPRQGPGQ